jgi:hypothetical protein
VSEGVSGEITELGIKHKFGQEGPVASALVNATTCSVLRTIASLSLAFYSCYC